MMKRAIYIPLITAAAVCAAACQSELKKIEEFQGGTVCFLPTIVGSDLTAGTRSYELVSSDGSTSIPLQYTVREGIEEGSDAKTRGIQKNTGTSLEDLGTYFDSLYVKAWKGNVAFISSYELAKKGTDVWETAETHLWNATESATFYAYANVPGSIAEVKNTSSTIQTLEYEVPTSAAGQQDILLGYYQGKSQYNSTLHRGGIADLTFYHPLTAVKFKKGNFDGVSSDKVKFKSISISGVYDSGKATMTPTTMQETDPGKYFNWDTSGSTEQTVTLTPASDATYLTVASDGLIGEAFLLIPQTMTSTEKVKITVEVELDGTTSTLEAELDDNSWEAGKTNIYTLGYDSSTYFFSLSSTTTAITADKTFTNTTSSASEEYVIYSEKTSSSTTDWDWDIKSYQIGTAEPVNVSTSATNFTAGGLVVSEDKTNNKLKITAQEKVVGSPGSNAYWRNNTTPARTENLDWSPAEWTSYGMIDLSKYDCKSDTRDHHSMTTANCYIIRHAGTYKIPLVYGNAVKDGAINTTAYNPGTTGSTSNLSSYVTHKGIAITSPFIEYNKTSSSSSINLSPTGCRVVWSENSGVISNIEIPSPKESVTIGGTTYNISYLAFTVPQDKICQNNAVIAVSDGSGTMWSWHIWTTNDPDVAKDPIAVTNGTKEYDFFPMYFLGWIEPTSYLARSEMKVTLVQKDSGNEITITVNQPRQFKDKAQGLMYQWGRKDPMPTKSSLTGFEVKTPYSGVSLADAIQNPGNAYYPSSTTGGNWCSTNYYNLWSGTLGTPIYSGSTQVITASNDATTKTVYDPSPVGYKVPSIYAYTPFSKTGATSTNVSDFNKKGDFNVGWEFYTCPSSSVTATTPTIFFYAAGWRSASGLTNSTDGDGNYHSAFQYGTATTNSNNMCYFSFGTSKLELTNTQSKSLGACVRPVKE